MVRVLFLALCYCFHILLIFYGIESQSQSIGKLAQAVQAVLSMSQNTREGLQQTEQLTRKNEAAIARLEEKMEILG